MDERIEDKPELPREPEPVRWWKRMIRIFLALMIVGAGIAGAAYLNKTAPRTAKRPPAEWVPVVQVEPLRPAPYTVTVKAMGTVVPARRIVLRSRVLGQVDAGHPEFVEGGFLNRGERILQLEDADYRLALQQAKSRLVESQYALKLELGRQEVAKKEWALLQGDWGTDPGDSDLALRKPHLEKAMADVAAAEASVEKAALDLARTRIEAPFNAMVLSRSVDLGSQVSPQEPLAELVGTDIYWVQASIPVDRLDWIRIPQHNEGSGSPAAIVYAVSHRIEGRVARLMGDLTSEGRMAQVLIEIEDPLRLKQSGGGVPPLLIGEYVRVEIEGRKLADVFVVPRTALRDNDTIWMFSEDSTLEIRKVSPIWRDAETVVLENKVQAGDRLVVSGLPAPVAGMKVRLEEAAKGGNSPPLSAPAMREGGSHGG
ncbi:MAG: efflux RND transporter periplasmic adaptor subunit [Desulfobacterales bacterium]|nr:efflux RND transporter periplasmic adaptor subunit [Desulfobacterales bacterium]